MPKAFACIEWWESRDEDNPPHNGEFDQWGYWQETDQTFHSVMGLSGHASQYSKALQLEAAERIQRIQGWHVGWPQSSRLCGL